MIQANELRIGNYVKDRGNKILRIDWFDRDKICQKVMICDFEGHPLTEYFDYLQPILLTEELLLKCGFKYNEEHEGYTLKNILINYDYDIFGIVTEIGFHAFEYLHQLQNIFFALTGKELNIEL